MNYLHISIWLLALSCYFSTITTAQITIEGTIIDATTQEALPGVSIWVEKNSKGTVSDWEGKYNLTVENAQTEVRISFVGYQTITAPAGDFSDRLFMEPQVATLSKVVVSASRDYQNRADAPVAIHTLTQTTIDDTRSTSLDQLLNKTPGVFMLDLGNEQHSMSIRQPISFKSLFLYLEDGLPIRPTGVFNHNALLEINQANTRSVEIIRGPSSSLYGSEAIGGAVNFITLRPTALPMAFIRLQGNNLGYKRVDAAASATFGKFGFVFAGYYANMRNGFREHSDFDKLALSLKLNYKISPKDYIEGTASIIDYRSDMTGSLDSVGFYGQQYSSLHTFTMRDVWSVRSKISYRRLWNDHSKTNAVVFFRDNSIKQIPSYRVKNDYSPWGNPNGDKNLAHGENNDNSYRSFGALIQHKQQFDFWKSALVGGLSVDFSPNSYKANYISIQRSDVGIYTGYTNEADSILTDYNVGLLNGAAYVQYEATPLKNFRFTVAARYDIFRYDYKNNLDATAFSGAPDNVDVFHAVSPKVGITYTIAKNSGIYANYSQGFVPPQVGELYRGVKVPVLKPANYSNYELGGWLNLWQDKIHFDLSLYWMDGINEIISVMDATGVRSNQNAGKTRHIGVEYGLTVTPVKGLNIRFSGTNAEHKFVDYVENGTSFNGKIMNGAPAWIANAEVIYKPPFFKGFRIGVELQHMSPYYMDAANTKMYQGFTVFNLRAGYTIKGFEIWANLLNFTNQHYALSARRSRWGDSYTIGNPININIGLGYKFIGKNIKKKQ